MVETIKNYTNAAELFRDRIDGLSARIARIRELWPPIGDKAEQIVHFRERYVLSDEGVAGVEGKLAEFTDALDSLNDLVASQEGEQEVVQETERLIAELEEKKRELEEEMDAISEQTVCPDLCEERDAASAERKRLGLSDAYKRNDKETRRLWQEARDKTSELDGKILAAISDRGTSLRSSIAEAEEDIELHQAELEDMLKPPTELIVACANMRRFLAQAETIVNEEGHDEPEHHPQPARMEFRVKQVEAIQRTSALRQYFPHLVAALLCLTAAGVWMSQARKPVADTDTSAPGDEYESPREKRARLLAEHLRGAAQGIQANYAVASDFLMRVLEGGPDPDTTFADIERDLDGYEQLISVFADAENDQMKMTEWEENTVNYLSGINEILIELRENTLEENKEVHDRIRAFGERIVGLLSRMSIVYQVHQGPYMLHGQYDQQLHNASMSRANQVLDSMKHYENTHEKTKIGGVDVYVNGSQATEWITATSAVTLMKQSHPPAADVEHEDGKRKQEINPETDAMVIHSEDGVHYVALFRDGRVHACDLFIERPAHLAHLHGGKEGHIPFNLNVLQEIREGRQSPVDSGVIIIDLRNQ